MDPSARHRLPAPQNAARAQPSTRNDPPPMMSEIDGRVDQLALVQDTLLNGATPTMITGFAMIIAQTQAQAEYPDVSFTITSRVGPIERSATFRDGTWQGYDLTHSLIDPRSHVVYGEPTRPPMDQERSLRISQSALQTLQTQTPTPLPSPHPVQFSCTLPIVPPPVLTPPMPLASEGIRLLTTPSSTFMPPSTFQGGGVQVDNTASATLSEEQPRRTVTFKDSYEELTQTSSRTESQVSEPPQASEPASLVGFQMDPQFRERQREQQKAESKAANTVVDLREKIKAGKRAREATMQSKQSSSTSAPQPPSASPTQPETRRPRITHELLTHSEKRQLDITARDALRLQREIPTTTPPEDPLQQKFETATGTGDYATRQKIEKATVGVLYNRPVKKPVFTQDGCPPWFNRMRAELERVNSTYMRIPDNFLRQRPGRFDEDRLRTKNYARDPITILPMGKDLLQKTRIAFFVDSTMKSSFNSHNTLMDVRIMNMPCTTLNEMAEVTDKVFTQAGTETIPLPPLLVYSNVIDHLALRGTLEFFRPDHERFTEGFVTDEVTNYVETMANIAQTMRRRKAITGTVFMSPPGYVHLPRTLQQFLYLVMEAAYARDLAFYIVAPNLRISNNSWRPCEASYPAFIAEVSKALQSYVGYRGNSQMVVDEAAAFDYGMEMARRSLNERGDRIVNDPNESERNNLVDNLWFERRDESTVDEKTHEPKFHKELTKLMKETETVLGDRKNSSIFPMAQISLDAEPGQRSPTLAMLLILARDVVQKNIQEPTQTYQTWHDRLREPLGQVAERLGITFPVFLHNISPFWLPSLVQAEYGLDEQRMRLYMEAMERATVSELLAYLMAVGLTMMYRGPSALIQKFVLNKGGSALFSFLVFSQNQRGWISALIETLDPAGSLKLKTQLDLNIQALLVWIYSTWVNVSGIMHPLDECPAINRDPNQLPGFLFPTQVATLMLVETEDLMPLIAPIVWPIFGAVMALRYPTQTLRVAAVSPSLSILHFVTSDGPLQGPTYQSVIHSFANLRPPMAYTVIKDRQQVEHNYLSLIKARARSSLPLPMEIHPVVWLHTPIDPNNGAVATFEGWDVPVVLRILRTIIQRLGGRRKGEEPTRLLYPYACDTSRIYCARTEPREHTARILNTITCWAQPELVDLAIHQTFQQLPTTIPTVAKEPSKKDLPVNTDVPSNPRMALEIFVRLHGLQRERTRAVGEEYARGIRTFRQLFIQYGHQELADGLPNLESLEAIPGISDLSEAASGSSRTAFPTPHVSQDSNEILVERAHDDVPDVMPPSGEPMTGNNFTFSDATTPVRDEVETNISNLEAADIESELNNLLTIDEEYQNTVDAMGNTSVQETPQDQLLE